MSVCDGLGKQTTVQVINKTTSMKKKNIKNQKSSSGVEKDIGERGGRSRLAIASRLAKGGKAGVEGERFKANFSDGRDGCTN
jgi:hypothetical protein